MPAEGNVQRASSVPFTTRRTSVFAVAFARVLRKRDFLEVASDHREGGEHANNREADSEPPVKNYRNHVASLVGPRGLADIAVSVEVFVEAQLDPGKQPRWYLVIATLVADDDA